MFQLKIGHEGSPDGFVLTPHLVLAQETQPESAAGPHGPLATQARQRTARSPGASETAYWSPDGVIGAIRKGEPEAPQ